MWMLHQAAQLSTPRTLEAAARSDSGDRRQFSDMWFKCDCGLSINLANAGNKEQHLNSKNHRIRMEKLEPTEKPLLSAGQRQLHSFFSERSDESKNDNDNDNDDDVMLLSTHTPYVRSRACVCAARGASSCVEGCC
eukprot:GHVU01192510.1.p2 GENE.GHVU01192510.1~~GHVU01192510.1.p2  ORF type:complete len:136 (+),score=16.69 GHVU01192510.1:448-855(+)